MTERGRESTPRGIDRRTLLGAVVGASGLAGCMQPLLDDGDAANAAEADGTAGPADDDSETATDADGEPDDGVDVVDELQLEPAWDVDIFGSRVLPHDGHFLTQVDDRQLTAIDTDGGVQWQATPLDIDDHSYALPGASGHQNGMAVREGVIYVGTLPHGDAAGRVYAVESGTGSIRFEHRADEPVAISQLVATAEGVVYYGFANETDVTLLCALEDDGGTRWTTRLEDDGDGLSDAHTLVAGEGAVLAVGNLAAGVYDLADGSLIETIDLDPAIRRALSSDDARIYLRTYNGDRLTALERSAFDVAWQRDLERSAVSPTTLADGVLYAGTEGGYVHAYDAEDGTLLWESPRLAGRIDTAPTVDEFVWLTDDVGTIYALEREDGTVRYREDYPDGLDSVTANEVTIAAIDGTVVIGESGQAYRVRSP